MQQMQMDSESMRGPLVSQSRGVQVVLEEPMWETNLKLGGLIVFTFAFLTALYSLCLVIESMYHKSFFASYQAAGGIFFGFFIFYVFMFGVFWYRGAGKRDNLRRQAVEKAIAFERANQALNHLE